MMFLVVLSLCVASSLAKPSIGYSYATYAPSSYSYSSYTPYKSVLTPYALKSSYAYSAPASYGYAAPAPYASYAAPAVYSAASPVVASVIPSVSAAVLHSAPAVIEAHGLKTQYHTQDAWGQASYGHSEPHQSHSAVQDANGNKVGSFSYVKPDGGIHRTDYVADAAGYRVASNDLPIGPAAAPEVPVLPAAIPIAHETPVILESPTVPAETPEVIAAKAAHFAAHAHAHSVYKRSIYGYASPVVTPSGHLADTPEVAAAKAAHFAEHAKRGNYYSSPYYGPQAYYNSYASPVVTPSGYLADTPEVAAAKAAHFAEKAKASAHAYNAIPYVSSVPGHVGIPDTPEVAAAKAAHFAEHAAVSARNTGYGHGSPVYPYAAPYSAQYSAPYSGQYSAPYTPYSHSYYASPVVTPSGFLADTPEVAQAKAAHLAEHAAVAHRQKRSILLGQTPASTVPLAAPVAYAAPAPVALAAPSPYAYPYAANSYAYSAPHSYAYSAPVGYSAYSSYPKVYSAFPFLKSATHTSIVHGPHAVSYQLH